MQIKTITITILAILASAFSSLIAQTPPTKTALPQYSQLQANHRLLLQAYPEYAAQYDTSDSLYTPLWPVSNWLPALGEIFTTKQPAKSLFNYNGTTLWEKPFNFITRMYIGTDYIANDKNKSYLHGYRGFYLAYTSQGLSATADWWTGNYRGNQDFAETSELLRGYYKNEYNSDKSTIYNNRLTGSLSYQTGFLGRFALVRGHLTQKQLDNGPVLTSGILFSDTGNDYTRFEWEYKPTKRHTIRFSQAALIADSTDTNVNWRAYPEKYLATHSFSYNLPRFGFTVGEVIVYGSRGLDISYTLPQAFWRIAEHKQGSRDNVMIFASVYAGLVKTPGQYLNWYTRLLMDELRATEVLGDWWGNKYALQTVFDYGVDTNCMGHMGLSAEFTAVRPWIYTHESMINKFTNDRRTLGFEPGPNSLTYALGFNWQPVKMFSVNQTWWLSRQGGLGNSPLLNYTDREKDTADWLEGGITDTQVLETVLDMTVLPRHRLRLYNTYTDIEGKGSNQYGVSWRMFY